LENTVHFHEGDDEATTNGNAAAHVAATGAPTGDGNAVAVGEGENFRDLFGGAGKGDSGGKGGSYPSVGGVGLEGGRVETKSAYGEESRKGAERIFHLRR
jgi:hypothetical protein